MKELRKLAEAASAAQDDILLVPDAILQLLDRLEAAEKDAKRYQWLTADHDTSEMRDRAEDAGIRLRWIGKGAADASIDKAMEAK